MKSVKQIWDDIGRNILSLFKTCFITCDFSILTNLRDPEVQEVISFFNGSAPLKPAEEAMLQDVFDYNDVHLLQCWCDFCTINRGYLYLPGILRITGFSERKLIPFLESRPWVKSFVITRGAMTETYEIILKNLSQQCRLSGWRPEIDLMWRQITITLGPVPLFPYDPNDPVTRATRFVVEKGITVIVAAGNEGHLLQGNSMNPWARPPWVIGVGATTKDGSRLLETSSRGAPSHDSEGPTVVAPGESFSYGGLSHGEKVAIENIHKAPPGSYEVTVLGNEIYIFSKGEDGSIMVSQQLSNYECGPPMPIESFLDVREKNESSKITVAGTSYAAEYVGALCAQITKHIKPLLPNLPKSDRPKLLKTILEDLAHPFGNYQPWEIGKGLVTETIVNRYLNALSTDHLMYLVDRARSRW